MARDFTIPPGLEPDEFLRVLNERLRNIGEAIPRASAAFALPSQNGHAGEYLQTNGLAPLWAPVDSSLLAAAASGNLVVTAGAWNDVTGATVTLDRAGVWLIVASFAILAYHGDNYVQGRLDVAGAPQAGLASVNFVAGVGHSLIVNAAQVWRVEAAAGDVAKLQGTKALGAQASAILAGDTTIAAHWVSEA